MSQRAGRGEGSLADRSGEFGEHVDGLVEFSLRVVVVGGQAYQGVDAAVFGVELRVFGDRGGDVDALQGERGVDLVIDETFPGQVRLTRATGPSHHMLYEDPMRLAVRDPTVRAIAELAEHPWVMGPVGTPARQWAMSLRHEAGFEADVAFESAEMLVHARLAAHGHAAAFLPDLVWFDRTPDVTLLEPASTHRRTILATVRSASGDHPLIHTMLAALRRAVEQAQASVDRHLGRTGR